MDEETQAKPIDRRGPARPPDFSGNGVAVWINKTNEGEDMASVQLFGKGGIQVNCFKYKEKVK